MRVRQSGDHPRLVLPKTDPESRKGLILAWIRGLAASHLDSQHPTAGPGDHDQATLEQRPTGSRAPVRDRHGSTGAGAKLVEKGAQPRATLEPDSGETIGPVRMRQYGVGIVGWQAPCSEKDRLRVLDVRQTQELPSPSLRQAGFSKSADGDLNSIQLCRPQRCVDTAFTGGQEGGVVSRHPAGWRAGEGHQLDLRAVPEFDVAVEETVGVEASCFEAKASRGETGSRGIEVSHDNDGVIQSDHGVRSGTRRRLRARRLGQNDHHPR